MKVKAHAKPLFLLGITLAAIAYAGMTRADKTAAAAAPPAVVVQLDSATSAPAATALTGRGLIEASQLVQIKAEVDGKIRRVHFREGAIVQQGDLLFELEDDIYAARLRAAQSNQAKAIAALANAKKAHERSSMLVAQQFLAQSAADTSATSVQQLEAEVAAARSAVEIANIELARTKIRAPLTGRAGKRLVDSGNLIRAADATVLLEIAGVASVSISVALPEDKLAALQTAQQNHALQIELLPLSGGASLGSASLGAIANSINHANGTIELKLAADNAQGRLWPGQAVNVRLVIESSQHAIFVPEQALFRSASGDAVYIVDRNLTVALRNVVVQERNEGKARVTGMQAGEKIIIAGQARVAPGSRVIDGGKTGEKTAAPTS